ncbi:MAG: dTMP kinase [Desulfamplus sp.]|nr:dTMP kinase [Desulfamplus sp.]
MFITLEGIEGSGKTTQMPIIVQFLKSKGHEVVMTREPGATEIGQKIRSILLDPENSTISPLCELLLYAADRAQHLDHIVLPSLEAGKTVLCDRFADATTVYQGAARGIDPLLIKDIHAVVPGNLKPHLTFLFDLDPKTGLARTFDALAHGERGHKESRFERESLDFHHRVRQGYLALARQERDRFVVVDASLSRDEISGNIIAELEKFLFIQHL